MTSGFENSVLFGSNVPHEIPKSSSQNCLISLAANQALRACKATRITLQELRESLIKCQLCSGVDHCELPEHFNQLVDQAVSALSEEWGW
jgi:hypothetical protein